MAKKHSMQMYGVSAIETENDQLVLPQGAELRKIYVDVKEPLDTSFEKYGHLFYNVYIQNAKGRWIANFGLQVLGTERAVPQDFTKSDACLPV